MREEDGVGAQMEEVQTERWDLFLLLNDECCFFFSLKSADESPREYLAWSSWGKFILPVG